MNYRKRPERIASSAMTVRCCISARATRCASRILTQLADERVGSREQLLAAQVKRVDWRQTAGELGADAARVPIGSGRKSRCTTGA